MSIAINVARAERIRELRQQAGLSREKLARFANCSAAFIVTVERGYVPEKSAVVPEIERVLAVLTGAENEQRPGGQNPAAAKADDPGQTSA